MPHPCHHTYPMREVGNPARWICGQCGQTLRYLRPEPRPLRLDDYRRINTPYRFGKEDNG